MNIPVEKKQCSELVKTQFLYHKTWSNMTSQCLRITSKWKNSKKVSLKCREIQKFDIWRGDEQIFDILIQVMSIHFLHNMLNSSSLFLLANQVKAGKRKGWRKEMNIERIEKHKGWFSFLCLCYPNGTHHIKRLIYCDFKSPSLHL